MSNFFRVNCYDVGDFAGSGVTVADSRRAVFGGDVVGECSLSFRSFALAETSASFEAAAISDAPHSLLDDSPVVVPARRLQPESCTFAVTRHCSLIWLIALSVVKSFPAIRSIARRPRAASRRNPLAVIEPSGKASAAATASRSG
jgi:hypothetical protein